MEQIACRQGALPIYVSLAGGKLNRNVDVAITSISTQFLSTSASSLTKYAGGILNGIPCLITRTVISTVETYVIRASNDSQILIADNSIFYPDSAYNAKDSIQVLWWGRNNVPNLTALVILSDNKVLRNEPLTTPLIDTGLVFIIPPL